MTHKHWGHLIGLVIILLLAGTLVCCTAEEPTSPAAETEEQAPTQAPEPTEEPATEAPEPEPTEAEAAPEPTEAPTAEPEPTEAPEMGGGGGTIYVALGSEPQSIDPFTRVAFVSRHPIRNIFNTILGEDLETGEIVPELAESWEISEDGLSYTFHLRQDVVFHDGQPMTSADVKYTIDRIMDPDSGTHQELVLYFEGCEVEAPDAYTVVVHRPAKSAVFLLQLTDVSVVPAEGFDPDKPVGTGPFKFDEWVRNERLVLTRNEDYWKPGLPKLDSVVFVPIPDEETRMAQLATGQIHMIDVMPIARLGEAEDGSFQVLRPEAGVAYYPLLFNTSKFPVDDYRVRQALNYAIDREALQMVLFGQAEIRSNPIPPNHWAFNPDALSYNTRDLDKAMELLTEAGWGDSNNDGILDKEGQDMTIVFDALNIRYEFTAMAEVIQANWAELGADVTVNAMELGAYVEKVCTNHDSQVAGTGEIPWADPGDLLARMIGGCHAVVEWQNDRFDELLKQGERTVIQEDRVPIYHEAQEIFQSELPSTVLMERPIIHAAANSVQGFRVQSRQIMNFETTWLEMP